MISKTLYTCSLLFLSLTLLAQENSVTVQSISVDGNTRTKDFVILRELVIHVDSSYTNSNLQDLITISENRVMNTNLFNTVDIEQIGNTIKISVIEKWYIWPLPFVEFSDRNFNVWQKLQFDPDRTNYGLYVFNYNLFGRNHTLKTRLRTGYNTQVGFEYRMPFISKKSNLGLITSLDYSSQNEVWLNTLDNKVSFFKNGNNNLIQTLDAKAILSKRFRPYTTAFLSVGFENARLDSSVQESDFFLNRENQQNTFDVGISLQEDTRDNIYFPTTGRFIEPKIGISNYSNSTSVLNYYTKLKVQFFNKLKPRLFTAFSFYGAANTEDYLPYHNRRMLGYDEIVRGFEQYVIDGTSGFKGNIALRYQIINQPRFALPFIPIENYKVLPINVYLEGYADGGFAYQRIRDVSNTLANNRIGSVGLGINTILYNDRVLRLEYSYNSLLEGGFFVHFKKAI